MSRFLGQYKKMARKISQLESSAMGNQVGEALFALSQGGNVPDHLAGRVVKHMEYVRLMVATLPGEPKEQNNA